MTRRLYISPVAPFAYDRAAILRAAWAMARHEVEIAATARRPFIPYATTARAEFAACLRRVWARARDERSRAAFFAAQDAAAPAEAARRAALPVRDRQLEDARTVLMFAEHGDSFTAAHVAAVEVARARLASLQQTA